MLAAAPSFLPRSLTRSLCSSTLCFLASNASSNLSARKPARRESSSAHRSPADRGLLAPKLTMGENQTKVRRERNEARASGISGASSSDSRAGGAGDHSTLRIRRETLGRPLRADAGDFTDSAFVSSFSLELAFGAADMAAAQQASCAYPDRGSALREHGLTCRSERAPKINAKPSLSPPPCPCLLRSSSDQRALLISGCVPSGALWRIGGGTIRSKSLSALVGRSSAVVWPCLLFVHRPRQGPRACLARLCRPTRRARLTSSTTSSRQAPRHPPSPQRPLLPTRMQTSPLMTSSLRPSIVTTTGPSSQS